MFVPACWRPAALAFLLALTTACAAPPDKEIAIAQGAIDAARAAGAADFATAELAGAEETLARAHSDVGARDYRAALGHALDANARAQSAARAAAEGRVTARLAAQRALDDFARLIERVETALAADEAKRVPAPAARQAQTAVDDALRLLASLRATVEGGEPTSLDAVGPATASLEAALAALTAPPSKRGRPRR